MAGEVAERLPAVHGDGWGAGRRRERNVQVPDEAGHLQDEGADQTADLGSYVGADAIADLGPNEGEDPVADYGAPVTVAQRETPEPRRAPAGGSPRRSPGGRFGRLRLGPWQLGGVAIAFLTLVALSGLLLGTIANPFALASHTVRIASTEPTLPARAMPTEVDPVAAHNAALGCAPNAPTPLPGVLYGGNYRGSKLPAPKEVAITFDDGPSTASTPTILSILERTHTQATFFVEGQWVTQHPDLLLREWNDGDAIGNHSWDHPMMAHLTKDQLAHQFGDTNDAIHRILGADACLWLYRPPYANYNPLVLQTAQSYGLSTITWDDGSLDWGVPRPSPQDLAHRVLVGLHPGAVILFHDGPNKHPHTEQAVPLVIQELVAHGYLPVTLPRLLADCHYPGVTASGLLPPMPSVPPDLLPSPVASGSAPTPSPTTPASTPATATATPGT